MFSVQRALGGFGAALIRLFLRVFGRTVRKADVPWLLGPIGPDHIEIGGRFTLASSGERFGDPGFYRVLELDGERLKVRHLRSLREHFAVYVDDEGVLRCDHRVRFLGMTMLRLHYRMRPRLESARP